MYMKCCIPFYLVFYFGINNQICLLVVKKYRRRTCTFVISALIEHMKRCGKQTVVKYYNNLTVKINTYQSEEGDRVYTFQRMYQKQKTHFLEKMLHILVYLVKTFHVYSENFDRLFR